MTAVDFRCEQCGKLLNVEAEPGQEVSCVHCQAVVVVPAALANLPRPQVPGVGPTKATVEDSPAGDGSADAPPEEELEEVGAAPASGTVTAMMPWMLSLFLHLGVGLIMAFTGMMYVTAKVTIADDIEIPGESFSKNAGGQIQPGSIGATRSANATDVTVNTNVRTTGESVVRSTTGTGAGLASRMGGDAGSGGAKMGLSSGAFGRGGAQAKFFNSGGGSNIHHLVFVIDRSGSMEINESGGNLLKVVKQQMRTTIRGLNEVQSFHIIFFAAGEPIEMDARALVPANPANKDKAAKFLEEISGSGRTDPIPGLKRAVAVLSRADASKKGKQIFLLTDGDFPDNNAVKRFVQENCISAGIFVNTYLFGANAQPAIRDTMVDIARMTGGKFKAITD